MDGQGPSPQGVGIATLFDSLSMSQGDLSYRMEGMCQVVSMIIALLNHHDRKYIAEAILRACKSFRQFDQKNEVATNKYALQTLEDLSRF